MREKAEPELRFEIHIHNDAPPRVARVRMTGSNRTQKAPMIGGLVTSFLLELLVYPPIYAIWKWHFEMKRGTVDVSILPVPELQGHGA